MMAAVRRALYITASNLLESYSSPSLAAGGERAFTRLRQVLTPRRNLLSPGLVDKLTRIALNAAQLSRPDPVNKSSRSRTNLKLRVFFFPGGGGEGAEEDGGDASGWRQHLISCRVRSGRPSSE